jgi:apolipoprotein N-acyltransferase
MPPTREQVRTAPPKWWAFVLAGLCYSLFTVLAFPPAGGWVLAVFAPVPLVWAGCRATQGVKKCALFTSLGALPLWAYEQAWLWDVTPIGCPLLVIYLSMYAGLFVWLFALTRRTWSIKGRPGPLLPAWVVAPIIWTALEVLCGEVVLTGYPWYLAGHPLIEAPVLASPASLLGAYFVSFLLVGLSGALADAAGWMGRSRASGGIGAGVVLTVWLATALAARPAVGGKGETTVRIGVVQTNIPQDNKLGWKLDDRLRDWAEFAALTKEAAASRPRPDLIVWPETMYPGDSLNAEFRTKVADFLAERRQDPEKTPTTFFLARLLELSTEVGVPLLIGAEALEGVGFAKDERGNDYPTHTARYNSTYLIEDGRVREDRYDKIERTPFGEVIPYAWRWPAVQRMVEKAGAGGMKFDLSAGRELRVFALGGASNGERTAGSGALRFVTPICFEATKPELCRRLLYEDGRRRASLIVNVSNDGWFGPTGGWRMLISGGRAQHLQASRWRCVELGVPMIRAVNTGISAHVERTGKIRRAGPDGRDSAVNVSGVMVATVTLPADDTGTVFGRIGNVFGWSTVGATVLLPFVGSVWRRRRMNRYGASA